MDVHFFIDLHLLADVTASSGGAFHIDTILSINKLSGKFSRVLDLKKILTTVGLFSLSLFLLLILAIYDVFVESLRS